MDDKNVIPTEMDGSQKAKESEQFVIYAEPSEPWGETESKVWQLIIDTSLPVKQETMRAMRAHKPFNSAHEAYAVLLEEVDELFDAIKQDDLEQARAEAIQCGAMCLRFLIDIHPIPDLKPGQDPREYFMKPKEECDRIVEEEEKKV